MVAVRGSALHKINNIEFYALKDRGVGVEELGKSSWASKDDLGEESSSGKETRWSEDEIPLKGAKEREGVQVHMREHGDVDGRLSPV